jgi:hypothetical protein
MFAGALLPVADSSELFTTYDRLFAALKIAVSHRLPPVSLPLPPVPQVCLLFSL